MDVAATWLEPSAGRSPVGWPGLDDGWLEDGGMRWHDCVQGPPSQDERLALALDHAVYVLRGRWLQERGGQPQALISRSLPSPGGSQALPPATVSTMLTLPAAPAARLRHHASAVIAGAGHATLRRLLHLPLGAPLLVLRQCRYAEGGQPMEARTAVWRADAATVLMEMRN